MKKSAPVESPDSYVRALTGRRRSLVESLRKSARAVGKLDEQRNGDTGSTSPTAPYFSTAPKMKGFFSDSGAAKGCGIQIIV